MSARSTSSSAIREIQLHESQYRLRLLLVVTSHVLKIFFSFQPASHAFSDSSDFTRSRKPFQSKYANTRDLHGLRFAKAVIAEAASYAHALAKGIADFIEALLPEITGYSPALNSIVDTEVVVVMHGHHLYDAFN